MIRPTFIDMNPAELKYYPIMISLNICTGSCNVSSSKISIPKEIKDINIKAFNMTTNNNEATAMTEHISCDYKCKFNCTKCNSKQNGITKHVSVNVKIIARAKSIVVGILAHSFVRIVNI